MIDISFTKYFILSLLAALSTIVYAIYTREQFYPIILFLVSSKVSYVVNANFLLALTFLITRIVKRIFLGKLRDAEIEMLYERAQYAFIELCIALTVFRGEGFTNPTVMSMLWLLLVSKAFHWLAGTRLDYLDQIMPTSSWAHIRLGFLIGILMGIDISCSYYSIQHTLSKGRSVVILFGFEFGLLCITSLNLVSRFVLHIIDIRMPNGLISKGLITMIIDLICDAFRLVTYMFFISVVVMNYGLPIHLLREVYMAFYTFQKHLFSFIRYLKLTKNLEERFANATPEECAATGDCLICREALAAGKKLACSHVFHVDCLRMWLQHKQSCPLCRAEIDVRDTGLAAAAQELDAEFRNADQIAEERRQRVLAAANGRARGDESVDAPAVPPAAVAAAEVEAQPTVDSEPAQSAGSDQPTTPANTPIATDNENDRKEPIPLKLSSRRIFESLSQSPTAPTDQEISGVFSFGDEFEQAGQKLRTTKFSKSESNVSLPCYFIVSRCGDHKTFAAMEGSANGILATIRESPTMDSKVIRTVKVGTILFGNKCIHSGEDDDEGSTWIQVVDGFVKLSDVIKSKLFDVSVEVFLYPIEFGSLCHSAIRSKIIAAKISYEDKISKLVALPAVSAIGPGSASSPRTTLISNSSDNVARLLASL